MPSAYKSKTPAVEKPAVADAAPDLAALLNARISGTTAPRQLVRDLICLDPQLYTDRMEAAEAHTRAEAGSPAESDAAKHLAEIDEKILASSVRVVLLPITGDRAYMIERDFKDEDGNYLDRPLIERWRVEVAESFQEARTLNGDPFAALTPDLFEKLLGVMSDGEVNRLYRKLDEAKAEPSFPSSPK